MPASEAILQIGSATARSRLPSLLLVRRLIPGGSEDGLKKAHFRRLGLPLTLVAPQLLMLAFFFFIPSWKALSLAFVQVDPFGQTSIFVGLANFTQLFATPEYRESVLLTLWFTMVQALVTLLLAVLLAFATTNVVRGRGIYKVIILLPYAVAPVVSGSIWAFLFNPSVGPVAQFLHGYGIAWDPNLRPGNAQALLLIATVWKHVCYDYIFLSAALLAVPKSLEEAAALDGAGPIRRFLTVSLPLITPTVFFLIIMNIVYGLFEIFAIIDTVTGGGPAGSTSTLVYKVYLDGFVQMDLGSSAAQSVILMAVAIVFTILQFRAVERKVNYQV
jgi:sn-glycerol 3-phosphate transport system permease protein